MQIGLTLFVKKLFTKIEINLWLLMLISSMHFLFLIIFNILNIKEMVYVNIYSCINYVLVFILYYKGNKLASYILTYIEIYIHQIFANYFVGFNGGFANLLLCTLFIQSSFFTLNIFRILSSIFLISTICVMYYYKSSYTAADDWIQSMFFYINTSLSASMMSLYGILANLSQTQKISELTNQIYMDFLTGLYNRKYFKDKILPTFNENESILLAICDIDDFKKINDNLGHDTGDLILKLISNSLFTISTNYKANALRWGGEEFLLCLKCDEETAYAYLNKIQTHIKEQEYTALKQKPTITIGGVYIQNPIRSDFDTYFKIADDELYYGKKTQKNTINLKYIIKERQ